MRLKVADELHLTPGLKRVWAFQQNPELRAHPWDRHAGVGKLGAIWRCQTFSRKILKKIFHVFAFVVVWSCGELAGSPSILLLVRQLATWL